jgi:hypothetical protein
MHVGNLDTRRNGFDTRSVDMPLQVLRECGVLQAARIPCGWVQGLHYGENSNTAGMQFYQGGYVKAANEGIVTMRWDLVVGLIVLLVAVILAVMEIIHWY